MLDRFFRITEPGSKLRTKVLGAITTFAAILTAIVGSILMGENAYLAYLARSVGTNLQNHTC